MTAREKFQIGDRVRLSEEGKEGRRYPEREGEITGFVWYGQIVKVKFDGNRASTDFHSDFLEKIVDEHSGPQSGQDRKIVSVPRE